MCSPTSKHILQETHSNQALVLQSKRSDTDLSLQSLVDRGFTVTQAEYIHDAVSKIRGGSAAKRVLPTLTALFVLGLNPSSVLKVLEKCPELYTVKESQFQQRIDNLRKLGLVEGETIFVLHVQNAITLSPITSWVPLDAILSNLCF